MNILIPISGRSDAGLVQPIVKRLREHHHYVREVELNHESWFVASPSYWNCVLITGDRVEQTKYALKCFLEHISIAHLYAGITNEIATFDDVNRHCITLWSDVQFCENKRTFDTVEDLCLAIDKTPNCYNVGITHLDDLAIDESQCPTDPYDVVLYNPPTLSYQGMTEEVKQIHALLEPERLTIIVESNADEGREQTMKLLDIGVTPIKNYPRPQFLGLLKNCCRFLTNSSCAYYEAPAFLKPEQIIPIGKRNFNRSSEGPLQTGASDKIVKILEDLYG